MDLETIKVIGYILLGGIVIIILSRFAAKPKKCSVCGTVTKDEYLSVEGFISFCREHLIQRWKKDFTESSYSMIVIEPDFSRYKYAYLYGTMDDLKEWSYPKEDTDNLSSIMDTISGKTCKGCGEAATVAYFKKEYYNFPYFSKINTLPEYFCKVCVVKNILPLLGSAKTDFIEGVYAPTKDRGVYHIQEF